MRQHSSWMVRAAAIAAAMMALGAGRCAQADPITGIVSFGDSMSDVGNYSAATGGASPPAAFGYASGNFTNGMNWVQYLAKDLGVAAPTPSASGGTDYAYGGATTGTGTTSLTFLGATASVPNMGQQVADYLSKDTPTSGQLFTLWGGANDVLNAGVTDPKAFLNNLQNEITALANAGAKQFLVGNMPALGMTPAGALSPGADQLDHLAASFNKSLNADMISMANTLGVQIHVMDVYNLFRDAVANPGKYGFTNVTDPAISKDPTSTSFLFWDTVHPTSQADSFVGALGAESVPEPSTLLIFAAATLAVAAGRLRSRV